MNSGASAADPATLRQAIAALEAQRPLLGDDSTELALAPLRQMLAQAEGTAAEPQLRRSQVTVLFADIVESTALASRLDAEDVLAIFGAILQRAAACVRARGGRVLRYTGDGLKAGFGTQGTREDDAVQAVLAGLDILAAAREHAAWVAREHGVEGFTLRVGAHTGEVALGAGFENDNTLTGDTVNIAARMEQAAPPGGLRISAETWAHVRGRFEGEPQPALSVKGVEQPMSTWLVRAARSGAIERGIEGLAVPMIGRDAEQSLLLAALQPEPGRGLRAITVVADGGIGKTRLLRETLAAAAGLRVLLVRAHPGAELRPWGLLHGLFSAHCGIGDGDSAEQARERLVHGLAAELTEDAEAQAQRIGQLLGMDFGDVPALRGRDARALRDLAFAALLDWLAGLVRTSAGASVVLVFEDLHWADEASLDALAHWIDQAVALPLTLLMSARPALLEQRPAWCSEPPACQQLTLAALPEADRPALADALLQRVRSPPAPLRELLVKRAEGNPFYMEELLRRLLDDGVIRREGPQWEANADRLDRLRLPTTLVGLLQARLDALPPAERLGAQRASIVGHVFWDDALARIDPAAPDALQTLQQRQWVRQRAASAFEGTAERQFDHHLLHQVTYDTVLKEDRRQGHAAVARWLAERTDGRAPEFVAITGDHAERAGETALAIDCYEQAAEQARSRYALGLAIDCVRKALKLLQPGAPRRRLQMLELQLDLADQIGNRPLQHETLDLMAAVLAEHPDPVFEAGMISSRAMLADREGRLDDAFALATEAAAKADAVGCDDTSAYAHSELCWLHGLRREMDSAAQHLAQARAAGARIRATKPVREITALLLGGVLEILGGRCAAARVLLEQVLELATQAQLGRSQMGALNYLSSASLGLSDLDRALDESDRFLQLAQQLGQTAQTGAALYLQADVLNKLGRHAEALAVAGRALQPLRQSRSRLMEGAALNEVGHAHAGLGNPGEALAAFGEARTAFEDIEPGAVNGLTRLALMAEQHLALGDTPAALAAVEQVLAGEAAGLDLDGTYPGDTFAVAWACQRVLAAGADPRAAVHLQALQNRVWVCARQAAGDENSARALIGRSSLYQRILAAPSAVA